jgi:hypothetical protein
MLRTLLLAAFVLLLLAWIFGRRGVVRSNDEVAKYIDDFLQGRGDERDWDEFTSVRIRDPYLDRIRQDCSDATSNPPALRALLEELRARAA